MWRGSLLLLSFFASHARTITHYPLVAVPVGYPIAARRAKLSGPGSEHFAKLGICVIIAAFLGGHLAAICLFAGGLAGSRVTA